MPRELPKDVIMFWRTMSADPSFELGLQHLRRDHAPSTSGDTVEALLQGGAKWSGYHSALDHLTDILTKLETKPIPEEDDRLKA